MSKLLKRYFTAGLLTLLPTAAAIWVIFTLLKWLEERLLAPFFKAKWLADMFGTIPDQYLPWLQGATGLIIIFFGVAGLGVLATNVFGRILLGWVDTLMKKVPLVNTVYNFVKGLIENLSLVKAGFFQKVALVEFPRKGSWTIGFVTCPLSGEIRDRLEFDNVAVFVPQAPNPTTGNIVVVSPSDVRMLDMSPEEALKFIMSGGVLMPGAAKEPKSP
jgi:uncharacterized membrane protein